MPVNDSQSSQEPTEVQEPVYALTGLSRDELWTLYALLAGAGVDERNIPSLWRKVNDQLDT